MKVSFLIENELRFNPQLKALTCLTQAGQLSLFSDAGSPASKTIIRGDFTVTSSEVTVVAGAILDVEGTADGVDHVVVALQGLRPGSWKIIHMEAPEWGQMCCEWEDLPPTQEEIDEAHAEAWGCSDLD